MSPAAVLCARAAAWRTGGGVKGSQGFMFEAQVLRRHSWKMCGSTSRKCVEVCSIPLAHSVGTHTHTVQQDSSKMAQPRKQQLRMVCARTLHARHRPRMTHVHCYTGRCCVTHTCARRACARRPGARVHGGAPADSSAAMPARLWRGAHTRRSHPPPRSC